MERSKTELVYLVVGLAILVGAIVGAILGVRAAWGAITTVDRQLAGPLIAASATILVAVITVVLGKQIEHRRELEQQNRLRKIGVYESFVSTWFKSMVLQVGQKDAERKKLGIYSEKFRDQLIDFSSQLILWGNPDVVAAYGKFRGLGGKEEADPRILTSFEDMLFAIRRDLGESNKNLGRGDLLALFLTDPDTVRDKLANLS